MSGGSIAGGVFACQRQPVQRALRRGLYGVWEPTDAEVDRLEAIFPTGVCDYTKRDASLPPELRRNHRGEDDHD